MSDNMWPEHDKVLANRDKLDIVNMFYDWLDENHYHIAVIDEDGNCTYSPNIEKLLADWIGIDQKKLMNEKQKMFETMRAPNE